MAAAIDHWGKLTAVRLLVITPHLTPDTAPTGVLVGALVDEWGRLGHDVHVITSLPWYAQHRVVTGWRGWPVRRASHAGGTVTRLYPFPVDKAHTGRRAAAFGAFTVLAGMAACAERGPFDAVVALSPPITLAFAGRLAALRHRCPLILNVQDVFPDVAVIVGKVRSGWLINLLTRVERIAYQASDALTVLSSDLADNVSAKAASLEKPPVVEIIPNFLDTDAISPIDRKTSYRAAHGLGDRIVVMYAGNLGHSQSLELIVEAAWRHRHRDDLVYLINGGGVRAEEMADAAAGLENLIVVDYQPAERLAEVLGSADIHVVLLRAGLGVASVPSKAYSALAAGRPVVASVDQSTEVARVVVDSGAGLTVAPEDPVAFTKAIESLAVDAELRNLMGAAGRTWVESRPSVHAVAEAYLDLVRRLGGAK